MEGAGFRWFNVVALLYVVLASEMVIVTAAAVHLYRSEQPVRDQPWALIALLTGAGVFISVAILTWILVEPLLAWLLLQ